MGENTSTSFLLVGINSTKQIEISNFTYEQVGQSLILDEGRATKMWKLHI